MVCFRRISANTLHKGDDDDDDDDDDDNNAIYCGLSVRMLVHVAVTRVWLNLFVCYC
jgi:hypothetical protein